MVLPSAHCEWVKPELIRKVENLISNSTLSLEKMRHYLHAAAKVRNDIADLISRSVIITTDCSDFFKAPEKYLLGRLWLNFT